MISGLAKTAGRFAAGSRKNWVLRDDFARISWRFRSWHLQPLLLSTPLPPATRKSATLCAKMWVVNGRWFSYIRTGRSSHCSNGRPVDDGRHLSETVSIGRRSWHRRRTASDHQHDQSSTETSDTIQTRWGVLRTHPRVTGQFADK